MLLQSEIREQGDVLAARCRAGRAGAVADAAALLLGSEDVRYLVIAARGSSDNAARYAQYLLGLEARLPVALATPCLYADAERAPLLTGGAVMAISQSGASPDLVAVAAAARAQGRPAVVLTNEPGSSLAAHADVVVPLLAGAERSVAATKTYTASLHALAQIAGVDELADLPALVRDVADEQLRTRERFDPLATVAFITATGRGLAYATACESALKLRELSGIPAEALSPPDLMHGPVAALGPSSWLWAVEPGTDLLEAVARRGTRTVVVSSDDALLARADIAVRLPVGLPPWAVPIVAVIPAQAAALRLAELRGVDVDAPHGLAKVTLTP